MSLSSVVADIASGRVLPAPKVPARIVKKINDLATTLGMDLPIIDATMIYETYQHRGGIALYEDHPCVKPPWPCAWVGYTNSYGNEIVTMALWEEGGEITWFTENDTSTAVGVLWLWSWCGGLSGNGRAFGTFGPYALTMVALNEWGAPLDIHWVVLEEGGTDGQPEWPRLTCLGAYNLLNCSNTTLVPKAESRPERRRRERTGISVVESVIHVTGTRRQRQGTSDPAEPASLRLHSVRGHVAHYGDCCPGAHEPRGLLFGQRSCRVWVPQHARGDDGQGKTMQRFIVGSTA